MNKGKFLARHAMGRIVRGTALVAKDGFSARYDLDRIAGVFSRPEHKLFGRSYLGRILVLDTAKGGVATAWMLHEMAARGIAPAGAEHGQSDHGAGRGDGSLYDDLRLCDRH